MLKIGGKALEKTIMELFKHYELKNIHCQQNHPETIATGQRVRKHGFDFQVYYENIFYAFDAKHCEKKRFSLNNCKTHQIKALYDIEVQGGQGFFLIYFLESKKLNRIPASDIIGFLEKGIKSIVFEKKYETKLDILEIL